MKIVYSNFDSIYFAVQGALRPESLERLRRAKALAKKEDADQPISLGELSHDVYIKPTGQKGGYAFVLDMGYDAQIISLKDNISLLNWNCFVKIRAMSLALKGYEKALEGALDVLSDIGFDVKAVSVNRVDYAIDVLTPYPIAIDPDLVVTHSRRQVKTHYEPIVSVSQAREVQSITIGKMTNSQVIIYDKIAEVKAKRNYAWFKIWGMDRYADDYYIKRVEIRACKGVLKAHSITSIEALNNRIGAVLKRLVADTRYVAPISNDSNISRRANHPLWNRVTNQLENGMLSVPSAVEPHEIELIRKEAKAQEYSAQILGNAMGLAHCRGIGFRHISDVIKPIIDDLADMQREGSYKNEVYAKKYARAQDRLRF